MFGTRCCWTYILLWTFSFACCYTRICVRVCPFSLSHFRFILLNMRMLSCHIIRNTHQNGEKHALFSRYPTRVHTLYIYIYLYLFGWYIEMKLQNNMTPFIEIITFWLFISHLNQHILVVFAPFPHRREKKTTKRTENHFSSQQTKWPPKMIRLAAKKNREVRVWKQKRWYVCGFYFHDPMYRNHLFWLFISHLK